jgi:hypothetical protein
MNEETHADYALSIGRACSLANDAEDETKLGGSNSKGLVLATLAQFWLAYADHLERTA